ncbi:hypothetical protein PSAB6_50264 [Paraburkholderia sabiae]|nr:hypothetical protein PSAB6_50264 [Paraburkholderia sabiae]
MHAINAMKSKKSNPRVFRAWPVRTGHDANLMARHANGVAFPALRCTNILGVFIKLTVDGVRGSWWVLRLNPSLVQSANDEPEVKAVR